MKELFKVTVKDGQSLVSAKELHAFTCMETRFDIWIQRMLEYGFAESVDYQRVNKKITIPNGGSKLILEDYALTLSTAKEIAMIQRNDKGKEARLYFLECEKRLIEQNSSIPKSFPEALRLAALQAETIENQNRAIELANSTIQIQAPKVQYVNEVLQSTNTHTTTTIAKELGMSAIQLNKLMKEKGIQ